MYVFGFLSETDICCFPCLVLIVADMYGCDLRKAMPQAIGMELFHNKMLITHILASLFSYSMLTICSITSLSVFVQERILKSQTYNKYISSLLPSIYDFIEFDFAERSYSRCKNSYHI